MGDFRVRPRAEPSPLLALVPFVLDGEEHGAREDVFDVLAGVGMAGNGIVDGEGYFIGAVDVGEGDDFVDVDARVEVAGAD